MSASAMLSFGVVPMDPAAMRLPPPDSVGLLLARRSEFGTVFQPIVSLRDGHLLGLEALLRLPGGCGFDGPAEAIRLAHDGGHLVDLEVAALNTHIRAAEGYRDGRLFLNLSAPSF